ncbi:MAG: type II secretion system F family protein [Lachnospiraceae bacterium]
MGNEKWISRWFVFCEVVKIVLFLFICSYLFFDALMGILLVLPYGIFLLFCIPGHYREHSRKRYLLQYRDMLSCMLTALEAGSSPESAIRSIRKDISMIYGKGSFMETELEQISRKLDLGKSLEDALNELVVKTQIREIMNFVDIFTVAKRSGGDIIGLVRAANREVYEKIETDREIESIISANRMECMIMKFMPLAIILYFHLVSPSFLSPLYDTSAGKLVMILLACAYFVLSEYVKHVVAQVEGG